MTKEVVINLSRVEALVLFEFLSRFNYDDVLEINDQSEEVVLVKIHGVLEKRLAEPFLKEYLDILEKARAELRWDDS